MSPPAVARVQIPTTIRAGDVLVLIAADESGPEWQSLSSLTWTLAAEGINGQMSFGIWTTVVDNFVEASYKGTWIEVENSVAGYSGLVLLVARGADLDAPIVTDGGAVKTAAFSSFSEPTFTPEAPGAGARDLSVFVVGWWMGEDVAGAPPIPPYEELGVYIQVTDYQRFSAWSLARISDYDAGSFVLTPNGDGAWLAFAIAPSEEPRFPGALPASSGGGAIGLLP